MSKGDKPKRGRDPDILSIFESADDAMQGLVAYHFLVKMTVQQVQVSHALFTDKRVVTFKITHEWSRNFEVGQFFRHVVDLSEFQHCRTMLLAIIPQFEVALRRMKQRLWSLGKLGSKGTDYKEPTYKHLLSWAFDAVRNTPCGSNSMRVRLPDLCGEVDEARRLRNLSMHENNYFTQEYVNDAIKSDGILPKFMREFALGQKIFLVNAHIENLLYSHIEFLHMLHNTLQRRFFECDEDYNYEREGKEAQLFRVISGRADVRV